MPNGHPHFHSDEEPQFEVFFAKISDQLLPFASYHNLKLEKYYHEAPVWSFLFRHPNGGVAKIDVAKEEENSLKIWSHWWRDDYDSGVRFLKRTESAVLEVGTFDLTAELERVLSRVLSWTDGEWDSKHGGFKDSWQKHWTKATFIAVELDYPQIKV
jgi:hypothetical protein